MGARGERPQVFIGSSSEAAETAQAVGRYLRPVAQVKLWTDAFDPGKWTLQVVLDHSQNADFGIFVMAPDDDSVIRGEQHWTVRDNVLFEAGIFMGAIGPQRTFLL